MMALSSLMRRIAIARSALLLDNPFFGVLALQLRTIEDPSCDTAWTNGREMGFSPEFVAKLTDDQLVGLIAHEVMHCACGHPWRRDSREPKRWNAACDYAINGILTSAGLTLPEGGLNDAAYTGKYSEWIYDRLPEDSNGNGNDGDNGFGEVRDAPNDADAKDGNSEADWQQLRQQAAKIAQAQGKLPADLAREIETVTAPRVDWRSVLRRYVQQAVRSDYSWSRPNTRYLVHGLFLPALYAIECGRIAVAVDTSGSIDSVLLAQFAAEINAIAGDVHPSAVDVIYCDARVNRTDRFERDEPIELHACGGGGTDFRPVFDHIESEGDAPTVLIYLTDMYGTFPDVAPDYPVIWASVDSTVAAPFGDQVPVQ